MRHDVIDRLVRPANPVPDPQLLGADVVSIVDERERKEMQQQRLETDHEVESSGNRRVPWIGIAAAIVLVVGGFVVFQATETEDVATATPVEIAEEYIDAYAAFDVDRVASMLAEDAAVLPWESYDPRDWQADLRFLEAAGFQILLGDCIELPPVGEGQRVNCQWEAHGLGSDQIDEGPFGGHVFRLVIEDGLVSRSDMGFDFRTFAGTMWNPFQEWILSNHGEDFAVLYEDEGLSRQTDDAIALWTQRVEDNVAYVNGQ